MWCSRWQFRFSTRSQRHVCLEHIHDFNILFHGLWGFTNIRSWIICLWSGRACNEDCMSRIVQAIVIPDDRQAWDGWTSSTHQMSEQQSPQGVPRARTYGQGLHMDNRKNSFWMFVRFCFPRKILCYAKHICCISKMPPLSPDRDDAEFDR